MSEFNKTQSRLVPQHGNKAYWENLSDLVPAEGEIIIYDPDKKNYHYARFKVGDGKTTVEQLNFASGGNTLEFDEYGNATFTEGLNVDGNTTLNGDLEITKDNNPIIQIQDNTITINNPTELKESLTVTGTTALSVKGNTTLTGNLTVQDQTENEILSINDTSTTLNNSLTVEDSTTLKGDLNVNDVLIINTTSQAEPSTTLNSNLAVTSKTELKSGLEVYGTTVTNSIELTNVNNEQSSINSKNNFTINEKILIPSPNELDEDISTQYSELTIVQKTVEDKRGKQYYLSAPSNSENKLEKNTLLFINEKYLFITDGYFDGDKAEIILIESKDDSQPGNNCTITSIYKRTLQNSNLLFTGNKQPVSAPGNNQPYSIMENPMTTKIDVNRASIQNTEQYSEHKDTDGNPIILTPGVGSISTGFSHRNKNGAGARFETIATGTGSVAIGRGTEAFGRQSLAVGCLSRTGPRYENTDPNYQSTQTIPDNDDAGKNSLAVGFNNISAGESSITMGSTNYAQGKTTIAIGTGNTAYTEGSQVYGNGLKTDPPPSETVPGKQQIIIGNYNVVSSTADFIIANGTIDGRKNIVEITGNNIDIKGNLQVNFSENLKFTLTDYFSSTGGEN